MCVVIFIDTFSFSIYDGRSSVSIAFPCLVKHYPHWHIFIMLELRENGRNIVGFYILCPFAALLHVVGSCCAKFELIKLLVTCKRTQQLPTMLHPFARGLMTTEIQCCNSQFLIFSDSLKIIRPFYS